MFYSYHAIYQWKQGYSFQQLVLGQQDIYLQKNKVGFLMYTVHKNQLKMDQRHTNDKEAPEKTLNIIRH